MVVSQRPAVLPRSAIGSRPKAPGFRHEFCLIIPFYYMISVFIRFIFHVQKGLEENAALEGWEGRH